MSERADATRAVVGDRGYSGRPVRDGLRRLGVSPVIPQLKTVEVTL